MLSMLVNIIINVGVIFCILVSIVVANCNSLYGFNFVKAIGACVNNNGIIVKSAHPCVLFNLNSTRNRYTNCSRRI